MYVWMNLEHAGSTTGKFSYLWAIESISHQNYDKTLTWKAKKMSTNNQKRANESHEQKLEKETRRFESLSCRIIFLQVKLMCLWPTAVRCYLSELVYPVQAKFFMTSANFS